MTGLPRNRSIASTTVTISSGSDSSSVFSTGNFAYGSFQLPSAFTGATVEVQYSNDGTNWTTVPTEGLETNPQSVSANGTYVLPTMTFAALYVRLVSASNEAADRTITIFARS